MIQFSKSAEHLIRAEKVIPLGSQTFSKSKLVYPPGISPLFANRSEGPYIWDIDGNRYIDLVNGLASVILGYGDKSVLRAVKKQLKKGVTFSLNGTLEAEVAEIMAHLVPSAEMVRFGKNGSDMTSAAIRISRAYTGREHIAVCGYHGWHDWYIASTTKNKGVPKSAIELIHPFQYNNLASLEAIFDTHDSKIAAVILEPMNSVFPQDNFLQKVKKLSNKFGAILIFDEIVTGFRIAKGGGQELFDVIPDLSIFGKGIANGFPISAVVGKKEIMSEMENVFVSGTFGGELISLAAAKKVLNKHVEEDICGELSQKGSFLEKLVVSLIEENHLNEVVTLSGHPSWKFINWHDASKYSKLQLKTYFLQEVIQEGILVLNTHNITTSHSEKVLNNIAKSYSRVLEKTRLAIEQESLEQKLLVSPIQPLFSIR